MRGFLRSLTRRFWAWPWELRRQGVLGVNARSLDYIFPMNPRRLYARLDDKVLTKEICQSRSIPVPQTYAVVERFGDLFGKGRLTEIIGSRQQFVVKPACGSGGRGVVVVARSRSAPEGPSAWAFETSNGETVTLTELRYHMSGILSGLFSLGGRPDKALIEQRITRHPVFDGLAVGGTPDVRVLVYRDRPVMAMLRLPTGESRGRANLHQGAVGVGVDLATGRTTLAVHHNRAVAVHPDSQRPIAGIEIPCWPQVLDIASSLSLALGLGYIGVDVVLDAAAGPVVLEANARPGLAIQIANGCGLLGRCATLGAEHGCRQLPDAGRDGTPSEGGRAERHEAPAHGASRPGTAVSHKDADGPGGHRDGSIF